MTNNEEQDYQEDNQDETATSAEETKTEEQEGQEETTDWKAEALKYKAIADRKEKKLQKQPDKDLKTNQEQNAPTMEHMELFSQGATKEKIEYAQKYATLEGVTLKEAYASDICKSKFDAMDAEKKDQANSIKPSNGSPQVQPEKKSGEMTDEEHRKWAQEMLGNAKSAV